MSDESKHLAALARARGMKEWAEGENGFFELMAGLEQAWTEAMLATDATDRDTREALYHRIQAGRDIIQALHLAISLGKPAEAELARLKAIKEGERKEFH